MLERLDRLDNQNKITQDIVDQKKNNIANSRSFQKDLDSNGAFYEHKSVFSDEKLAKETPEVKQFPEDMKLNRDQEICKGCSLF